MKISLRFMEVVSLVAIVIGLGAMCGQIALGLGPDAPRVELWERWLGGAIAAVLCFGSVVVIFWLDRRRLRRDLLDAIESWEDALAYKGDYLAFKHGDYEETAFMRVKHGFPPGPPMPTDVKEYQRRHDLANLRDETAPCPDCTGAEIRRECQVCCYNDEKEQP